MRWEYATVTAGLVPIRGELQFATVGLNGHQWDYTVDPVMPDDLLIQMGNEGWELVSIISVLFDAAVPESMVLRYTLKRPRDPVARDC